MTATGEHIEDSGTPGTGMKNTTPAISPFSRWMPLGLLATCPVLVFLSWQVFRGITPGQFDERVVVLVLADFLYIIVVASYVLIRLAGRILYRRDPEVITPLSMTLVHSFATVAAVPTAIIAVIASLGLNVGIRDILSVELRKELNETQFAASEYVNEKYGEALEYAISIASGLDEYYPGRPEIEAGEIRRLLQDLQKSELSQSLFVFIINSKCTIIARGLHSYLYYYLDYREPPANLISSLSADGGIPAVDSDCARPVADEISQGRNRFHYNEGENFPKAVVYESPDELALNALVRLDNAYDRYLLAILEVSPGILNLHKSLVNEKRSSRDIMQQIFNAIFFYSLITLGVAIIIILLMMQFGVIIANRLSRPVHQMARVAQQVVEGDLKARINSKGTDEIAKFSRIFDRMIGRLDASLNEQIELRSTAEERERNFSEVLANVTAGVIGIDTSETIVFMNSSAGTLLVLDHRQFNISNEAIYQQHAFRDSFPECTELLEQLEKTDNQIVQDQIRIVRFGQYRDLLVRIARRRSSLGHFEGHVIAFDDISKLMQAQEKATWSSVAQQIAHEINNHMTPISMSSSQIESRVGRRLDEEGLRQLLKYTSTINDSIEGLIRISREFSEFARLPAPETEENDVVKVCRSVIPMEFDARGDTKITLETSHPEIMAMIDPTLLRQALVNIVKNAYEGIDARRMKQEGHDDWQPEIVIAVRAEGPMIEIGIMDNGAGFPESVPMGDFMIPFKTYRSGGSGLGLAYVDRIVKGHGGELKLMQAPAFDATTYRGAKVVIQMPSMEAEQHVS